MQNRTISIIAAFALIMCSANVLEAQQQRKSTTQRSRTNTQTRDASEQIRIVGLAPLSLLTRTGRIHVRGEYAYRPNKSVSVMVGIPVKTTAPGWLNDALIFKDEEGKVVENNYKSFVFNAGHRFYFGGKKPAGGFYLEPYLRYNRFTMTHSATNTAETGATIVTARIGGMGIGGAMGAQWRIGEHVSLDFTFAGADVRFLSGKLSYQSTDPTNDIVAFKAKVQDTVDDIPIIGNQLAAQLDGDKVQVRVPGLAVPGFRCNLTVGVAF
jgi:hypothetical protein